jgi:hypothetical protein
VIWINGAFGVGKTTLATLLVRRLMGAFLLDPEPLGAVLRDRLTPAAARPSDYQDLALWRSFTREAILTATESTPTVVVPMTLARPQYHDEIVGALRARVPLLQFTLTASRDTILERDSGRPDGDRDWVEQHVDRVVAALADERYAMHLDAERHSPEELAAIVLASVG